MKLNDQEYEQIIASMVKEMCPQVECMLKLLIKRMHPDPRLLLQVKCIDEFSSGKSLDAAVAAWIDDGYAGAFAKAYAEAETRFLKTKIPPEFEKIYTRVLELQEELDTPAAGLDFKI